MSLRYEWSFDLAALGGVAVVVDDDGSAGEAEIASGTHAHTSIATVEDVEGNAVARYSAYTAFAVVLAAALNTASTGVGTYTVTWNGTTGYTVAYSAGNFSLSFSTVTTAAQGVLLRQILGFSGDKSGAASYSSDARPFFVIIPTVEGRTQMTDEMEPDDLASEAVADDGTAYQVSRDSLEVWSDWRQTAETNTAPSTFSAAGTPVYARHATSAVPWTYQHAWRHMRLADHPFLVLDTGTSESAVHQIRAEGASFRPQRFAAADYDLWSLDFRTRLIGRLP